VNVVIGNEAADMDSVISAIVYAFLLWKLHSDKIYVPVINIPREDLSLRTDIAWLLRFVGLDTQYLVFFPEIESHLNSLHNEKKLSLILTDHNRLAAHQEKYGDSVVEILDHHKDENLYIKSTKIRVIDLVGSASTLVAERVLNHESDLHLLANEVVLGKLLMGTILLDTINLDPQYKKVTKKDEEIVKKILDALHYDAKYQNELFQKLNFERFSVDSLSSYDLLRMDYKQWKMGNEVVGISSSKLSVRNWIKKEKELVQELLKFLELRKLSILYVMVVFNDDQNNIKRELIIFTKEKRKYQQIVEFLMKTDFQFNQMKEQMKGGSYFVGCFEQNNVAASRKQLQPLLESFYSTNK